MINDKAVAEQARDLVLQGYSRIEDAMKIVETNCTPDEFARFRKAVGQVTVCILNNFLKPIYDAHPGLKPPGWDEI